MKSIMIYTHKRPFVAADIQILNCAEYHVKTNKIGYLKELFYFLTHRFSHYYIWFCDLHALIPTILSFCRSTIFIGGCDACSIPELRYGIFYKYKIRALIIKLIYKLAGRLIHPSENLQLKLSEHIKVKSEVIHLGVDTDFWMPEDIERTIDYITVGNFRDENTWIRKGGDRFIRMAKRNPDKKFVLIGYAMDLFEDFILPFDIPDNLIIHGYSTQGFIKYYFNRSKYYCQLSRYESFGYSLIEAMSMGCIPVVKDSGILEYIAGNIKNSEEARERVKNHFSIEIRKQEFIKRKII